MTILTGPGVAVFQGDCLAILSAMPAESVHAVVTDPPYGLEFMGKDWDSPWKRGDDINADASFTADGMGKGFTALPSFTGSTNPKCLNCGGTKRGRRDGTAGRKVCTCDAPRFPNVRAAEMRAFQAWCEEWLTECLRVLKPGGHLLAFGGSRTWHRLAVAIEDAGFEMRDSIAWMYGSGMPKSKSQLKPAFEPIVVARKPLSGTVAANVLEHGTGALNIDGCRVPATDGVSFTRPATHTGEHEGWDRPWKSTEDGTARRQASKDRAAEKAKDLGRWPTNVILDGNAADELDEQSGASRFFPTFRYQAKAPSKERPVVTHDDGTKTAHPTVKPLALMRWLVRLVTPAGGTVLDPFLGSGTTAQAARDEGFVCLGIERESDYMRLIAQRLGLELPVTADEETAA